VWRRLRFPAAHVVVAQTYVQGPQAPAAIVSTLAALAREPAVDVVVLARGGGSFEDLLPFSDERVVRAVAACPVPVVSAVGHEQDVPLCDLAADARASTPTAAARLVVPDEQELRRRFDGLQERLEREARLVLARARERLEVDGERLARAPALLLERKRVSLDALARHLRALSPGATVSRGYAIVRRGGAIVRNAGALDPGERVDVELATGAFAARVEEVDATAREPRKPPPAR
jgi:exodeoxyribonuclease VII large subunit